MSLIVRIDVDRPFGKKSLFHKTISRLASDLYFPRLEALSYLRDLEELLLLFNEKKIPAYIFVRRCSLPSMRLTKLGKIGNHIFGLHLENSRSLEHFQAELNSLERHMGSDVMAFSKHGSGKNRYGFFHFAPYEPEKYQIWGAELGMKMFFGNLEDPSLKPYIFGNQLCVFPSAFWLEPHWRDVKRYTVEWLCKESSSRDIVLLLHPDNVTSDDRIMAELLYLIDNCKFSLSFSH